MQHYTGTVSTSSNTIDLCTKSMVHRSMVIPLTAMRVLYTILRLLSTENVDAENLYLSTVALHEEEDNLHD